MYFFCNRYPDVGLLGNLLCAARTPALQKLFRTHTRTAPRFLMIAPAPALALFQKISALLQLFLNFVCSLFITENVLTT